MNIAINEWNELVFIFVVAQDKFCILQICSNRMHYTGMQPNQAIELIYNYFLDYLR